MKLLITTALAVTLAACAKDPERSDHAGSSFKVERLFTHEGCTLYRFNDVGHYRYYSNCKGDTSWNESCGKACTYPQGVTGGAK